MKTRLLFRFVVYHLIILTFLRLAFFGAFKAGGIYSSREVIHSFILGARFDLKLILLMSLPYMLLGWGRWQTGASRQALRWWSGIYTLLWSVIYLIYIFDFGHYGYLNSRVNSSAFDLLRNLQISSEMLWQSYPVLRVTFGFLFFVFLEYRLLKDIIFVSKKRYLQWVPGGILVTAFIATFIVGVHGQLSQYPLRWSNAFFSPHHFISHMTLNPVLYLFETMEFKDREFFNRQLVEKNYPLMSEYLGVDQPDDKKLSFARDVKPMPLKPGVRPNVVVIVMESLALSKTNLMENPLKPTPYIEALAKESYWFSNYYSPVEGTARNMFSVMTSVPDVLKGQTSSRNPMSVDQNLIMNAYKDYKKWYFLGGSANWANIRGIFSHNVTDIDIVEEGSFKSGRTDVWGISDLDLFIEAHQRFDKQPVDQPFIAVIQSAGFHRPYTIPDKNEGFKLRNDSLKALKEGGFYSLEQFNSMRFADHSLGHFFKLAKKSAYYKNTIFVITGDHGLPDEGGVNVSPARQTLELEKYHVPLILHGPEFFSLSHVDERPASHLDVMTTVAALSGVEHQNTALGRNLFDKKYDTNRNAFFYNYYSEANEIGLLNDEYYYRHDDIKGDQLYRYKLAQEGAVNIRDQHPDIVEKMKALTYGYYETARYLLYNNKKANADAK